MGFADFFTTKAGLSIRFILLRLLCGAAFVTVISDVAQLPWFIREGDFEVVTAGEILALVAIFLTPMITFSHHVANAFGPRLSFPGFLDFILVVGELSGLGFRTFWTSTVVSLQWPQPQNWLVITGLAVLFCVLSLSALTVVRVSDLKRSGKRSLLQRYDFTKPRSAPAAPSTAINRPSALSVLTGRALWEAHFLGETNWIIVCRAIIAIVVVIGITGFALWNIVFQPLQEMWLIPSAVFTSQRVSVANDKSGWNIFLRCIQLGGKTLSSEYETWNETVTQAVHVKVLRPVSNVAEECSFVGNDWGTVYTNDFNGTGHIEQVFSLTSQFYCPTKTSAQPTKKDGDAQSFQAYIHPDFLISVNYSRLGFLPELEESGPENIVQVVLAITDDVAFALQNTVPTALSPGVNLVGMAEVAVRQQLGSNIGALFSDNMKSFFLTEMVHIWADPRPLNSNTIPSGSDIATLRIKAQASTSDWKIIQDFRDKTVLNGFANVGGLWTFLEGIFAALFGSALLKIILGVKPLGIFGTAHSFQSKQLRDACITEYPRLEKDISPPEKERGLLNMICDHLLDVDFLAPPDTLNKTRRASEATQVGDVDSTYRDKLQDDIESKSLLEDDAVTLNNDNGSHSKLESTG